MDFFSEPSVLLYILSGMFFITSIIFGASSMVTVWQMRDYNTKSVLKIMEKDAKRYHNVWLACILSSCILLIMGLSGPIVFPIGEYIKANGGITASFGFGILGLLMILFSAGKKWSDITKNVPPQERNQSEVAGIFFIVGFSFLVVGVSLFINIAIALFCLLEAAGLLLYLIGRAQI